jgi:hypothetical protein
LLGNVSPFTYITKSDVFAITISCKPFFQWCMNYALKPTIKMQKRAFNKIDRITEVALRVNREGPKVKDQIRVGVIGDVTKCEAYRDCQMAEHNAIRNVETRNK